MSFNRFLISRRKRPSHFSGLYETSRRFVPGQLYYRRVYQTMEEEHEGHLSYMKIVNAGEKLIVNRHEGNLQVSADQSHAALGSRDR